MPVKLSAMLNDNPSWMLRVTDQLILTRIGPAELTPVTTSVKKKLLALALNDAVFTTQPRSSWIITKPPPDADRVVKEECSPSSQSSYPLEQCVRDLMLEMGKPHREDPRRSYARR